MDRPVGNPGMDQDSSIPRALEELQAGRGNYTKFPVKLTPVPHG